ncbi:hypothetical protein DM56_4009 [Burkholderia mallei]|nr:hypothetical protein X948_5565 [Burkholderia pseudomallei MSHR5608]KGR95242.1 hypothetical protein X977_5777 [Burkholderia pseudomallei MSHR7504]KGS19852.1 hypothetical protein X962_5753 [Burkholderia pseudomallei MSHR7343]KGS20455.1 hypothetical protein X941_5787 [Burkholderia pseudomallei MSHR5569]KGS34993.1 hypothetical protein X945_5908 [Burkholderia pseudomallei ABCPW 107]KGS36231.1 hypothetical protein X992_5975 [Burkholderia pseudomallei MSHR5492]KGS73424.1 hypothetical protein X947
MHRRSSGRKAPWILGDEHRWRARFLIEVRIFGR